MDPKYSYFPESQIDDYSLIDGTVSFYLKVKALYFERPNPRVLDFGAGRGSWMELDRSQTRRAIRDLRTGAGEVVAADVDEIVLQNICSHRQVLLKMGEKLPFDDASFDIVVSDFVFEHIADPKAAADELMRIVKPGGWICARTSNKNGYIALVARLIPNRSHANVLRSVQPDRKAMDVFPTTYTLSTPSAIRRYFKGRKVIAFGVASDPSYHSNRKWLYAAFALLHKLLPRALAPGLFIFVQK
jgi:ubiquinone/menaquinone biosynthesis C-methylase UbiE